MVTERSETAARTSLDHVSAISLFVEDLNAAKSFYRDVFGVDVVFEDENSVCVEFDHLLLNLLLVSAAQQRVEPAAVASREAGSRFQLTSGSRTSTRCARFCNSAASSCSPVRRTGRGEGGRRPSSIPTATAGRSHRRSDPPSR